MTNLKQYIEINRWCMTIDEMAEELGIPIAKVERVMQSNKWKALGDPSLPTVDECVQWARSNRYGYTPCQKEKRFKEAYTQSGSPYGIADETRQIKLKN